MKWGGCEAASLTLRPQPLTESIGSAPRLTSLVPGKAGYQDHGEGGCGKTQGQKKEPRH